MLHPIIASLLVLIFTVSAKAELTWQPKKKIEISTDQIRIDDSQSIPFKCPHGDKKEFGKLKIKNFVLSLSCSKDYLGGLFLEGEKIATVDSDAGDSWESFSLLFYDDVSKSLFLSVASFSTHSSDECDLPQEVKEELGWSKEKTKKCNEEGGEVACKKTETTKVLDPKSQKFIDTKLTPKMPQRKFQASAWYLKYCK